MTYPTPVLEAAAQAFADANAKPPFLYDLGPEKGRPVVDGVQAGKGVARPDAGIEELNLASAVGSFSIRIVRPAGLSGTLPVLLFIHGAGWVFGDAGTHDRLVRELATRAGAAAVFVNYNLSPEVRYPVAIEQAYTALEWIAEHGREHELDPARIAVAGDSVGGNMSAALTIMAKERGGPKLAAQLLYYPVTDANFGTDSYQQFDNGYWLTREAMKWYWNQYLPDAAARTQPTAAPLHASLEQLKGLPEALVIVGEADPLRDEGEAYAAKLREAGVAVTCARYQGIIHDFVMLDALRETHAALAATAQGGAFLRRALRKS